PCGSCEITTLSKVGSAVSCRITFTLKPEPSSVARAVSTSWLVTSGTPLVFGPFETCRVTVVPLVAKDPPPGDWPTTVSFGWSESTCCGGPMAKPAPCSTETADGYGCPTTLGTAIGFGPFETLMRTDEPSTRTVPALGSCAVTVCPG